MQAISTGASTLLRLYGYETVSAFVASHIETLRLAENPLANRCGEVLHAAQTGFGVWGESSLILIQLGRTLMSGGTAVAAGVTITNPIAMTCAAVGAVHYGWSALSDQERTRLLQSTSDCFATGIETVRSIVAFALRTIRELISSKHLAELKKIVADGAAAFERSLGDVTRTLTDRSRDAYTDVSRRMGSMWADLPSVDPRRLWR